jgi:hypothetical protein
MHEGMNLVLFDNEWDVSFIYLVLFSVWALVLFDN